MNTSGMAEFVTVWALVNEAAVLLLAGLSYFSSLWALDRLAAFEQWLYTRAHGRARGSEPVEGGRTADPI